MKNCIIDESPHKELTLEVTNISYLSIDHIMVRNILYWYNQFFHYNHCIIKSDMLESHYSKIKRTRTRTKRRGELSVI